MKYYKIDNRNLTYGEYWNLARGTAVLTAWSYKFFRKPLRFASALPEPLPLAERETAFTDLPDSVRDALRGPFTDLTSLGFLDPFTTMDRLFIPPNDNGAVHMRSADGKTVALLLHVTTHRPRRSVTQLTFISRLENGSNLVTTTAAPTFKTPPMLLVRRPGAGVDELWRLHSERLRKHAADAAAHSRETMIGLVERYEREAFDFHAQRGVYVPMTEEELARLRKAYPLPAQSPPEPGAADAVKTELDAAAAQEPAPALDPDAAVFDAMLYLQNRKSGWMGAVWILILSGFLFFSIGSFTRSAEYITTLAVVIFVHELGHFLAMRFFGYRNVRMFFIPLFGGAATGAHYNVAGWKKAMVSLMGPLPGIFGGFGLYLLGEVLQVNWLVGAGLIAVFINGINLLPFLPLDGGWFWNYVIFCRHPLLELVFIIVTSLGLLAAGLLGKSQLWFWLAVAMLVSAPGTFRVKKIAYRLKKRGVSSASPDSFTIPEETARTIIPEVRKATPGEFSDLHYARISLDVFEAMNATPPNGWASLLLILLYAAGAAITLVPALIILVNRMSE